MKRAVSVLTIVLFVFSPLAPVSQAGFSGTDLILPAVGRIQGANGSEFYTTVWVTNPSATATEVVISFLRAAQANFDPATFTDTIAAGATKVYDVGETLFVGEKGVLGAARIRSSRAMLVSARIYNQGAGQPAAATQGLFSSGIRTDFGIHAGQSGSLQGVRQNADFRYNIFLVETAGQPLTLEVAVVDQNGVPLGSRQLTLRPWEPQTISVNGITAAVIQDGILRVTAVDGAGRAVIAGSQVANASQDASGFEMAFREDLLGAGSIGPAGPAGPAGETGPAGPRGPIGPEGPSGPSGPRGATGASGPEGSTGAKGTDGIAGPAGATGAVGPLGPAGETGAAGANGLDGAAGATGATGLPGATGATGPAGPAGMNGTNGVDGAMGPTGATGLSGATGATGPAGPAGMNGTNGVDGAPGPSGPSGPAGANGTNGPAGATGPTGPVGATGPQGIEGPAGAFNLVDANGAMIGQLLGGTPGLHASTSTTSETAFIDFPINATEKVILSVTLWPYSAYFPLASTLKFGPPVPDGKLYYQAADCTGTPYASRPRGIRPFRSRYGLVFESAVTGPALYVTAPDPPHPYEPAAVQINSVKSSDDSCAVVSTITEFYLWPMTFVKDLSTFAWPLRMP